ncbi:MAG: hypothetical protein ACYDBQ_12570 [Thermoplasmatota archaeon]
MIVFRDSMTVCVLVILAGCTATTRVPSTTPAEAPAAASRVEIQAANASLPATAATARSAADAWGALAFSASGQEGDWVAAYQPFPKPMKSVNYTLHIHLESAAPDHRPVHAYVVPLFWTQPGSNASLTGQGDFLVRSGILVDSSGRLIVDTGPKGSVSSGFGSPVTGIMLAFTADAPWNASYRFSWGQGPSVTPLVLDTGAGAEIQVAANRTLNLPDGPAGQVLVRAAMAKPGWTDVQILASDLQPEKVRDFSVSLSGGFHIEQRELGYGYDVLGSGSQAFGPDYAGALWGPAGTLQANLTYAETASGMSLAYAHIPVPAGIVPAGTSYWYEGSLWPYPS